MMCVRRFVEVDDAGLRQWSRVPLISGLRSNKHKFVDFDNMSTCPSSMSLLPGVLSLRETNDVANSKGGAPHGRESFQGHGQVRHYHVVATGLWSGCLLGFSQNRFWGSILPPISSLKSHRAAPAFLCSYDITSQVSPSIKRFFMSSIKRFFMLLDLLNLEIFARGCWFCNGSFFIVRMWKGFDRDVVVFFFMFWSNHGGQVCNVVLGYDCNVNR